MQSSICRRVDCLTLSSMVSTEMSCLRLSFFYETFFFYEVFRKM